ncbi:MAG: hypothetical protein JRF63_07385 [Deltaproteobacteria bacterium]|nr:hypothetical protein [Deltaproteobacteria bacterium]
MASITIRAYEREDLPLPERLTSLGRRFPCLEHARGLDPFDPETLHAWANERGPDRGGFHAAMLLLNLAGSGPWERFDAVAAAPLWSDADKNMFVNWLLVWRF